MRRKQLSLEDATTRRPFFPTGREVTKM